MEEEIERTVRIPDALNAESFLAARFKELNALTGLMKKTNRVTSIFQRLPKRMRRRAMSHTIKRVPRNLRDAHKRQLVKNKALQKSKNKRKLHRRRPKDLLLEYNRRQKTNRWLETHIWHAKRFRMVTKWGYKLADQSYDKTFKASYRAMKSHCLIQDISHYSCIEIVGPVSHIVEGFNLITNVECGLSVKAKCWLNGFREGQLTMYRARSYPYGVIGNVTFMWRPSMETNRTLWLWCHPTFYYEVLDELIEVFKLKPLDFDEGMETTLPEENILEHSSRQKSSKEVENKIICLKNVPSSKVPRYWNNDRNVIVSELKDTINRFRLCGPLSNAVLTKALHPAKLFEEILRTSISASWWTKYSRQLSSLALDLLEMYDSPSQFPSHVIMGDYVVDPRLFLKRKREKALPLRKENDYCLSVPSGVCDNLIWNSHVRDTTSLTKFSVAKINKLRGELLVPGFDEQLLQTIDSVIPLLFVQRPGVNYSSVKLGFGSGWDLIIPANWAVPVWLSLILCGAKPGGLRETKTLQFETQIMPELFPDSSGGIAYYENIKEDCENLYFRKPPNKRVNFIKYGIPTPFHYPWQKLVEEWSSSNSTKPYFVYRNIVELRKLRAFIDNARKKSTQKPNFSFAAGSLIAVNVTVIGSAGLTPFSHICMPTKTDILRRMQNKMYAGPSEHMHVDTMRAERKRLRLAHTKLLKRLRRKRIKEKRLRITNGLPLKITKRKVSPTAELVHDYLLTNRKLWVPNGSTCLRKHCDREICGFVINSGFSYTQARTVGQGYITSESLSILLDLHGQLGCEPMILTRTPYSLCYRFCYINVVVPY